MQEEVENRTLTLVVSGTKFTGRMFKAPGKKKVREAVMRRLFRMENRKPVCAESGKTLRSQTPSKFEKIARKWSKTAAVPW